MSRRADKWPAGRMGLVRGSVSTEKYRWPCVRAWLCRSGPVIQRCGGVLTRCVFRYADVLWMPKTAKAVAEALVLFQIWDRVQLVRISPKLRVVM